MDNTKQDNTNQESSPSQQQTEQPQKSPSSLAPSKTFIVLLAIFLIAGVSIISYTLGTKQNQPVQNQPTANWKTYKNTRFSYMVRHPPNWSIDENGSEIYFIPPDSMERDNIAETIAIIATTEKTIIINPIQNENNIIRTIVLDKQQVAVNQSDATDTKGQYFVRFPKGNYYFEFRFGRILDRKYDGVFDAMVTSFTSFAKQPTPTPPWKTYTNEKLGFTFRYPQALGKYPLSIEEKNDSITLKHLTYSDLWITIDKAKFDDYKSLKPCSSYTSEEISKNPITCLSSGEYFGQKELIKEVELDGIKAVSFFPNNFSIGTLPWVIQTVNEPFIHITSYSLSKETFDQILSAFQFSN